MASYIPRPHLTAIDKLPNDVKVEIDAALLAGRSVPDIARTYGINKANLYYYVKRENARRRAIEPTVQV